MIDHAVFYVDRIAVQRPTAQATEIKPQPIDLVFQPRSDEHRVSQIEPKTPTSNDAISNKAIQRPYQCSHCSLPHGDSADDILESVIVRSSFY